MNVEEVNVEEDDPERHDHRLPAVVDPPRGYGEASWWPIVSALGVAGIYLGAGLVVVGIGSVRVIDPVYGVPVFLAGFGAFVVGLYGWLFHAFVAEYVSREPGRASKFRWGIWCFLGTEVATFGAGFVYYAFLRVGPWPPGELPHLLSSLVLANTVVLVASSVTLHFAEVALRRGRRRRFLGLLGATLALGVAFLAGQALEYYEFVVREGYTFASGAYFSAFFGLTGLHGLHVTLGVVLLATVLARALAGQYSAARHTSVGTVSTYWHFVDAVWIVLVAVLYVGATV